jgi:hypothetical protein
LFEEELREVLRDVRSQLGAERVAIVRAAPDGDEAGVHAAPLGGGAFLRAEFAWTTDHSGEGRQAAMERAARLLRTCARRWDVSQIPALDLPQGGPPTVARARDRMRRYLQALCNTEHAANALVHYRGEIIASAHDLEELQQARVQFTVKRVQAEASRLRGQTSHAEISGDDFYAVGFWFDACLLVFFTGSYSLDFIRHRARLVTRELAALMPLLDDDPPPGSIQEAPIP